MVQIVKANGEKEEFSEKKLLNSIRRAGIPQDFQMQALAHARSLVHEGITTKEIYHHIIEFLDTPKTPYAKAKYSLKKALMDLGPTGYPFEDYIAQLFMSQGMQTTVRNIVMGKCISHEIDVIAKRGEEKIMIEAKFHNSVGIKTDVHVALYTWARYEDVMQKEHFTKPLLVTNTKITTEAISYAQCVGMDIIAWDYPDGNSLRDLVERYNMFPITALSHLPSSFKQQLLEQNIVLCMDVCLNPHIIESLNLPVVDKKQILEEAQFLCSKS